MVLCEPAVRFYKFLDHAVVIEAERRRSRLIALRFPHLKQAEQQKEIKAYDDVINRDQPKVKVKERSIQEDRERLKRLLSKNK